MIQHLEGRQNVLIYILVIQTNQSYMTVGHGLMQNNVKLVKQYYSKVFYGFSPNFELRKGWERVHIQSHMKQLICC